MALSRPVDRLGSAVTTIITGVDTMAQSKGRNVKKRSSSVDTRPGQVDTRDSFQRTHQAGLDSVSTLDSVVSTLETFSRRPSLQICIYCPVEARTSRVISTSCLSFFMAPKGKRLIPRRSPISPAIGEGSGAPAQRRSKHRDDRLSELIVPQGLHLTRVQGTFTKFVQPRMGYKLVDGRVTRTLKGKEQDIEEESAEDVDDADDVEDDEDSQPEPMDAQGGDEDALEDQAPPAQAPSLQDFLASQMAQMQQSITTGFDHLNARFDQLQEHVNTRMDALADSHVQIQHRLNRLSTEFHEFRHPPAPGNDDVKESLGFSVGSSVF
ncbi:hypothetical protein Taro_005279, partial [Colocasia esculenta]|nr:hypothetical protein [Colocasia esculenta]